MSIEPTLWAVIFFKVFDPHFPHLQNGGSNRDMVRIDVGCSAQCPAHKISEPKLVSVIIEMKDKFRKLLNKGDGLGPRLSF